MFIFAAKKSIRNISMKKFFVSMVFALSALVMLTGCVVSEEKLTDKETQGIVEY